MKEIRIISGAEVTHKVRGIRPSEQFVGAVLPPGYERVTYDVYIQENAMEIAALRAARNLANGGNGEALVGPLRIVATSRTKGGKR